jgi:hypothetical protein
MSAELYAQLHRSQSDERDRPADHRRVPFVRQRIGFLNGPPFAIFYALMGIPIAMAADRRNRVLLLMIALIGNGLGPQIVGWLSVFFVGTEIAKAGTGGAVTASLCRNAAEVAKLVVDQQGVCKVAYGQGLRLSMITTSLLLAPAALFFWLSSRTLNKDMIAQVA